jgi:hypothetical protein
VNTETAPALRKLAGEAKDLVAFESLDLGNLPRSVSAALSDYILLRTEWAGSLAAVRESKKAAVKEASNRRRSNDADAIQVLARKSDFAGVASIFDTDPVAEAEADLARAERAYTAVRDAEAGMIRYLGRLVATEERENFLDLLATAWRSTVAIRTNADTTLGELAAIEETAATSRDVIGRLVIYAESVGGADNADKRRLRDALKENRDDLPTLAVIDREAAEAAANSPEALRREVAARDAAEAKAKRSRQVAEAAAYRRSGRPLEQDTSAAQEEDATGPEGQGGQ